MCKNETMSDARRQSRFGWIQINNAICPFVERPHSQKGHQKLLPLLVLCEGAQLRFSSQPTMLTPSEAERRLLNDLCSRSNFDLATQDTFNKFVSLSDVVRCSRDKVCVTELPLDPERNGYSESQSTTYNGFDNHSQQPGSKPVSTNNHHLVPTVVAEFYSGKQLMSSSPKRENSMEKPKPTPLLAAFQQNKSGSRGSTSTTMSEFTHQPIAGLRYMTLFQTQLLCIVKQDLQYVSLAEIHKAFFSKWPLSTFSFTLINILRCPIQILSGQDLVVIQKLSGDTPSCDKVIRLVDAETMLPKVKVLLRKIPQNLQNFIKKFTAQKLNACESATSKRLPRLSLIMEPEKQDSKLKSGYSNGSKGIGSKFGSGRSLIESGKSTATAKWPMNGQSKVGKVKRLSEPKPAKIGTIGQYVEILPHPSPVVYTSRLPAHTRTENHKPMEMSLSPVNSEVVAVGAMNQTSQKPQGKGRKIEAVLEKLTKMKS